MKQGEETERDETDTGVTGGDYTSGRHITERESTGAYENRQDEQIQALQEATIPQEDT
jgi:hypothetical protein